VDKGSKVNSGTVTGEKDSFISTLSSKVETDGAVEGVTTVSTKDMTLEEYKNYIHETISSFPLCSDRMGDCISINISENGFKAMQSDPEYEKWVLQDIQNGFSTPLPGWVRAIGGTDFVVANYGATKEECSCTSWSMGYQNGTGDKVWGAQSKGSFWTKRGEQKKIQDRVDKKAAEKKELEEKWLQEAAEKRQAYTDFLNGKAMLKTSGGSELSDIFSKPTDTKMEGIISAYEAGTIVGGMV
jgi:hypothetical protein